MYHRSSNILDSIRTESRSAGNGNESHTHQRLAEVEEKVANLTRLITLTQNMHESRDAELRKENEALSVRISQLEQENIELRSFVAAQEKVRLSTYEEMTIHLKGTLQHFTEKLITIEKRMKEHCVSSTAALEESLRGLKAETQQNTQLAHDHTVHIQNTTQMVTQEIEVTRDWAKRNMERLKAHIQHLQESYNTLQSEHQVLLSHFQRNQCTTDMKCRQLKALLLKKKCEVDFMTQAIETELRQVRQVSDLSP